MTAARTAAAATEAQRAAWAAAQRLWGVDLATLEVRPEAGMGSFAWFAFPPRVAIDPVLANRLGADREWESVFAHEIGHHVLSPSTRIVSLKLRHQMARAVSATLPPPLPRLADQAAWLSNLWSDLLINVRVAELQRLRDPSAEPGMVRLWRILRGGERSRLFWVVLRAYEELWGLPTGGLCPSAPPAPPAVTRASAEELEAMTPERRAVVEAEEEAKLALTRTDPELDASLLAATVRTFGDDPIRGALRFGMLLAPYLFSDAGTAPATGCGGHPDEAAPSARELGEVLRDPRLRETPQHPVLEQGGSAPGADADTGEPDDGSADRGQGYGLAETLELYGPAAADAVLEAWYLREARRYVHPYFEPASRPPPMGDDFPGATEPWEPGEEVAEIDWRASLAASPVVVPGVTLRRRTFLPDDARAERDGIRLDLYIDSSGSMPHPRRESPAVLAAVILVLSVLEGGGRVRVTSFASPGQVAGTPRFVRNPSEAVAGALAFFAGGTTFPLDLLADRYRGRPDPGVRTHLVVLSDDGSSSFFGQGQEQHADVADQVRPHLTTATLVLLDPRRSIAATAAAHGYDVEYLDRIEDAPVACAALAARIANPRSLDG